MKTPTKSPLPSSAWILIASNSLTILGVLFAGWDTFSIVFLYWLETAVIGGLTILRMLTASGDMPAVLEKFAKTRGISEEQKQEMRAKLNAPGAKQMAGKAKFFLVPFFCVHFGIFMFVHMMFISLLLGNKEGFLNPGGSPTEPILNFFREANFWFALSILGLIASHLYSYFANYIGKGEYQSTAAPLEMMKPYSRVVAMHLAILFGAFLSVVLGSGFAVLVLLVIGKTVIDLKLHLKEHKKREDAATANPALS